MVGLPVDIAVVGAGPAGAHLASLGAAAGNSVLLFDPKGAWEKPCGGGVTARGLREYSFLTASTDHPHKTIDRLLVVSSGGKRVSVKLRYPFAVYSRAILNDIVLQRALSAGAQFVKEKVVSFEQLSDGWLLKDGSGASWKVRYLVGADGAASVVRRHLIGMLPVRDTAIAMGYNVFFAAGSEQASGDNGTATQATANAFRESSTVVVEFIKDFSGYLWAFPRVGSINFGIASKLREQTSQMLRGKLDDFVTSYCRRIGLSAQSSDFFAAKIPILDKSTWRDLRVSGDGWALIGDAAGFVDPITGEGIYYALKSADLLFRSMTSSGLFAAEKMQTSAAPGGQEAFDVNASTGLVNELDVSAAPPRRGRSKVSSAFPGAPLATASEPDWTVVSARYDRLWRTEFGSELERASRMLLRFYRGRFLGYDFNDAMVMFSRLHPGIRDTMARAVVGEQSYLSLKRDLVLSLFRPF